MATIAPPAPATKTFPASKVEAGLRAELHNTIKQSAKFKGISIPSDPKQLETIPYQIDSLVCVDILCAIEPIVGFELPEKVVRTGGYGSIDSAIKHLMPRIQKEWNKKNGIFI